MDACRHGDDTLPREDEIGHIGAYSLSLRTRFNGFYPDTFVEVDHAFEDDRDGLEGFATVETWGEPVTEAVAGEER